MRVLGKVEGQHERLRSCVLDFYTATRKCGLGDESYLGINLAKNHVLVIPHVEFTNTAASAIRVEQRGTLRAEIRLAARLHGEPENRTLLVAQEITVNNPFCVNAFACEFFGGDGRP